MALLKSNQTLREKYFEAVQNKFEVLGEAEEVNQQWVKFKVAVTKTALIQIPNHERKTKQKFCITRFTEFLSLQVSDAQPMGSYIFFSPFSYVCIKIVHDDEGPIVGIGPLLALDLHIIFLCPHHH